MRVGLFDFALPESAIALRPAEPRDAARLLVLTPDGEADDRHVRDLPDLLRPGDVLVVNDTRVVRARLTGLRRRDGSEGDGARIEALLHARLAPDRWRVLARPAKRLRPGDIIRFEGDEEPLQATVEEIAAGGDTLLAFSRGGEALDRAVERIGRMPLPPYIEGRRPADARDAADYQTVFSARDGAVAAPTAGLHFTPDLLARLDAAGIGRVTVTLHVGAGTFLPVKADDTADHRMHAEWGVIDDAAAHALNGARARGGRIVAVGTTSLRLLESAAAPDGTVAPFSGWTDIFITPGYRFRAVDLLMTNFHLPRSTLFMLVSAFAGLDRMKAAYERAIASGYRFYSYGDSSLLHPQAGR